MTTIRIGDWVRTDGATPPEFFGTVEDVGEDGRLHVRARNARELRTAEGSTWFEGRPRYTVRTVDDGCAILLCARDWCVADAERFTRAGVPLCDACASSYAASGGGLVDVRPELAALATCACGESLDELPAGPTWPWGGIVCEYRQCPHCSSHRAYAPRDKIPGRRVQMYVGENDSHVTNEWDGFLSAIGVAATEGATLVRNGVALARAMVTVDRDVVWVICKPEREEC